MIFGAGDKGLGVMISLGEEVWGLGVLMTSSASCSSSSSSTEISSASSILCRRITSMRGMISPIK